MSFTSVRMVILRKQVIRQILYNFTYMWNLKKPKSLKQSRLVVPGAYRVGKMRRFRSEYKLSVVRGLSSGDLMYSMMSIINNIALKIC